MEIAKISSKGQITIPISVRSALKLRAGDKVVIQEENGRYYFDNASLVAFARAEDDFKGAAKEAGFQNEEEMQKYMMEDIRREVRGY
ncbi:MAG: AbrB/MazE/SpoVT family DNA-binding domain-containing protein [Synergistaceae bacterium]|nr:AbrB/MazE/SpoVT family DNA-binding domain-containing protein [Synergistaceae bacterium]MBQ3758006.1 AbrB/MazE/SpoVT family DNA-binding domain-containing protein [Synergistaceae bacterium]MBQ4401775.1 AbrB/MazE/SpoVT family DNA-binding domain-containing protein [Synergistaceae bacterium]MBQ6665145.1 AbrB/MazE/SpoVT family DNA-binding domain-containing protein [Synergistaceae bacterium]MBQ6981497.1 AbrB/MazE/SpoVT family DNA-binding domain-containing protein [Synergistaceae bacterium]